MTRRRYELVAAQLERDWGRVSSNIDWTADLVEEVDRDLSSGSDYVFDVSAHFAAAGLSVLSRRDASPQLSAVDVVQQGLNTWLRQAGIDYEFSRSEVRAIERQWRAEGDHVELDGPYDYYVVFVLRLLQSADSTSDDVTWSP